MGGNEDFEKKDEIYSRVIRAGKRTYFLDVKSTKNDDYYLTVTESKKVFQKDGRFKYEKHKIFLYREDFDKFVDGMNDVINFIKEEKGEPERRVYEEPVLESEFTDISFEDLENK